ncbi:MAG: glycoside hydrolase family 3 C-terminal domain-containing protein [Acholeplasmataceae bacterium]
MSLTFKEQIELLDGLDVWQTKPLGQMNSLLMTDGPHGIRKQIDMKDTIGAKGSVKTTCYPTASLTACSFDRNLLKKLGENIAKEAQHFGVQLVLGPGINIKRTPLCGRNFEYFSEDPIVSGELGAAFVRGVEDQGVGTSVKHFICNNQEKNRFTIDSIVDERALHEIYYKGFNRVLKEKPASLMASYNKLNGTYLTEHPILKDVVRDKWGYEGVIVSDWGAINHRTASVKMTCDLEMPTSHGFWTNQLEKDSQFDEELKTQISRSAARIQKMVETYKKVEHIEIDFKRQHEQARMIARDSMILAKNEDVLPLNEKENVAVISGFYDHIRYQGGGSSHVNSTEVSQIKDIVANYSNNIKCAKGFSIDHHKIDLKLEKEAVELANQSKKVIYIVGIPESLETEGFDRETLNLPLNQVELYKKLYEVNKQIIVVVLSGSVVNLKPFDSAKAHLIAYLGGQASALAIMDILYGRISPSGRLAETWIDDEKECNVEIKDHNNAIYYDESIFVGYRYYETFRKQVRYHFGHGLSYTSFGYKNFNVEETEHGYHVSVSVKNKGKMVGKEVVMIFIGNNQSNVFKAKRELKAFEKIELKPDEIKIVEFDIPKKEFMFYDIYQKRFVLETGDYQIELCKHSGLVIDQVDIRIQGKEIRHTLSSYNQYEYNPIDFFKLYQNTLPPKNVKKNRPFTLSTSLKDTQHTMIGKVMKLILSSVAAKEAKKMEDPAMKEVLRKSMMETPIRMLALFSNQKITLYQALGIVDVLNLKFIKGFKKLRQKK